MTNDPLIRLSDVSKVYHLESGDYTALDHVSLDIMENEFIAIMGPSGSGKSTIMNQLGILDVPTSGTLFIEGKDVAKMSVPGKDPYAKGYYRVYLPEVLPDPPAFGI